MSNPRVAGGASSSLLPAHHRQATHRAPAMALSVYKPCPHHLRLASARASTGAGRLELSRGCHPQPSIYSTCVRRSRTMITSCLANVEKGIITDITIQQNMRMDRIRKQLLEPEYSQSSYDTAWVAMVPKPGSPDMPCFPGSIEWILQNQQSNGSWGLGQVDDRVNKDVLSSTLACVLALKRWNVGTEHITRGLNFIGKNFSVAMDEQIASPLGFNITFGGMLTLAKGMGLTFPNKQTDINWILELREMELKRLAGDKSYGKDAYMAYVAEGLGNMLEWDDVRKFQRKNGSLFNSPSATAALLIHKYDVKAMQYLYLLVSRFCGSVPTVYPSKMYYQLCMVDSLEKIGISRLFSSEIKSILAIIYTSWLQKDEEIMLDVTTCAMAFRILRMNGYNVSSDDLSHVEEASSFHNTVQGFLNDTKSILELYKASKVSVSSKELILDSIDYWSGNLLREKLVSGGVQTTPLFQEVEYALKFPYYATMERLDHKRNIEYFDARGSQMLKTEILHCIVNQDLLDLAAKDFTFCQSIYQDELHLLERWAKENKLDQLQFARQRVEYCYFAAAGTIFHPELSDARLSWAKNSVLVIVSDDFFDVEGSREELENLVALVQKWDEHSEDDFYSEQVKILFYAIYNTINQLGPVASTAQNRDVKSHMIELWLQLLRSMMTEADWRMRQYVPTFEEYLANAFVSFTLGPLVLPALYFVNHKLSECVVKDQDYNELFRLMSTCGRLLNDIQGFERESSQGKLDSVSLLVLHSGGSMSIEEAKESIRRSIATCRKDMMRLVVKEDSVVPRSCREMFWKMAKICYVFYSDTDGFTSPTEMMSRTNAVIHDQLQLQASNPSLTVQSEQ